MALCCETDRGPLVLAYWVKVLIECFILLLVTDNMPT